MTTFATFVQKSSVIHMPVQIKTMMKIGLNSAA